MALIPSGVSIFPGRFSLPASELYVRKIDASGIDKSGPIAGLEILPHGTGVVATEQAPAPRQF